MHKTILVLLQTALLTFLLASPFAAFAETSALKLPEPFWKTPKIEKKLEDGREVLVSVKSENVKDGVRFSMSGVGHVNRSREHCFKLSQEYPRLKEVSDHFKTLQWDPAKNELFVVTEALGYQARMILKMAAVRDDHRSAIGWDVIWGHFKGMHGEIGFDPITPRETEMSLRATYEAKELPLPKILMGFALEVITQKVAEKMRTYIETHFPVDVPSVPAALAPLPPSLPAFSPLKSK